MLFGAAPVGWRWAVAMRSALAFGIPALIVLAISGPEHAMVVALGSFAVFYGEGRAYRMRWRAVLLAGAGLLTAAVIGAEVGAGALDPWQAGTASAGFADVVVLAVVAVITTFVMVANRAGPPGVLFFALACAVAMRMAMVGVSVATIAGYAVIGVASAVIVSMTPMLRDPHAPEKQAVAAAARAVETYAEHRERARPAAAARHSAGTAIHAAWSVLHDAGLPAREPDSTIVRTLLAAHHRFVGLAETKSTTGDGSEVILDSSIPMTWPTIGFRLRRSLTIRSHAVMSALRTLVAALVAGGVSVVIDLGRPDWAVIAAVLVLNLGPDRIVGTVRALHRVGGTVIGLALFAALYALAPSGLVLVLLLIALMFLVDMLVARNYGVAVIFITPLALLISGSLGGPIAVPIRERFIETLLGAAVAVATMWVIVPRAHRHDLSWNESRVRRVTTDLIEVLRTQPPTTPEAMRLRRDLQFELVGNDLSGVAAIRDEPDWGRRQWAQHAQTGRTAYDLLAECWATPPAELLDDPDRWVRQIEALAHAERAADRR